MPAAPSFDYLFDEQGSGDKIRKHETAQLRRPLVVEGAHHQRREPPMPETPFDPNLPPMILDDASRDARPLRARSSSAPWIAAIAALVALAGAYWWWQRQPASTPPAV